MDPSRIAVTLAVLLIGVGLGRLVMAAAGSTGDVLATLFAPPDRTLGWPRGVQESDEPWGWHSAAPFDTDRPVEGAAGDDTGSGPTAPSDWTDPPAGNFVIPIAPVAAVHVGVRPH